ncbi:MAG: amino acid ABC transporter permease [Verrucomicrobia bacterium]|nr:amino acid ABC transporter permease [Verrucomicrobiota bacterium]MBV9659198.1 amino acid ABC transporter permease [Verrucomicrobiota bacterium]
MPSSDSEVRTISDSSSGTNPPLVLPAPRRRGPLVTPNRVFNLLGWLILALIVVFLVIPAARHGNWEPFGDANTWHYLWDTPDENGKPQGGLVYTLYVGIAACLISTAVGFVFALGRSSNNRFFHGFCSVYIELMRALPSYLIIFYVFIGLPKFASFYNSVVWPGAAAWARAHLGAGLGGAVEFLVEKFSYVVNFAFQWQPPGFAIMGLSLYTSAVMAEIFRAGILSIEKGQLEAAYSLGLKPHHTIINIILPQALRRMVPAIVSQLITLIKDTSLASIIALQELTRAGKQFYEFYLEPGKPPIVLETLFVVAAIYFVICYALSIISQRLEMKQGR